MTEEPQGKSSQPLPQMSEGKEPSSFRLIFTLGLAGFLAGLILVSAYLYTKPIIDANKAAAIERAIYKVLPGCRSFVPLQLRRGVIEAFGPLPEKQEGKEQAAKPVYAGYDDSKALIGFAILGSEPGFQDIITVMMGYDPVKETIVGYEVLESKETPGLGDKIFKDPAFLENFVALLTEPEIVFAKKGEKQLDNQVEAITGATISSRAVIRLLNNSMNEWKAPIDAYLKAERSQSIEAAK